VRNTVSLFLSILVLCGLAAAKQPKFYQKGTLQRMDAVSCGYEEKDGKGLAGALIGTDSEHKKNHEMLCEEYVLRGEQIVYRIRSKAEKHPVLLPVGDTVQFRIQKDHMLVLAPEVDNKEREFFVTSMTPRDDKTETATNAATK
jgi:hypothetical protein